MKNKQLDVHGLALVDAIKVINREIKHAYDNGESILYVNHGFNNGNKIKTWCIKQGKNQKYVIGVSNGENEGITNFYIKIKL